MKRVLFFIFFSLILAIGFQNCSSTEFANKPSDDNQVTKDTVIGSAASLFKIDYDPGLEFRPQPYPGPNPIRVQVDLKAASLIRTANGVPQSCELSVENLNELKDLLSSSEICEPGPLPDNVAVCMAYSMQDIELSDDVRSVRLRPVMCHSGQFLCDGNDARLRAILQRLRDAPTNCSNI